MAKIFCILRQNGEFWNVLKVLIHFMKDTKGNKQTETEQLTNAEQGSLLPVSQSNATSIIKQPWQLTKVQYDFNLIEKNIYTKIIEKCQKFMNGENDSNFQVENTEFGDYPVITFAINEIEGYRHYDRIRAALDRITHSSFGVPLEEGWDFDQINMFQEVKSGKEKGVVSMSLTIKFFDILRNMHIYKLLDTEVCYRFQSVYAERIYELLVNNKTKVSYMIENLKKMFKLEDKYKNNGDFIKRVILPAQKEMKEMDICPFYFEYELGREGRKVVRIDFIVIEKADAARKNEKIEQLKIETASVVKLSDDIIASVKACFPKLVIREDVKLKLMNAQLNFGVNETCGLIVQIKVKYDKAKAEGKIKGTMSAYFIGTLERMTEEQKQKIKELHTAKVVEKPKDDNVYPFKRINVGKDDEFYSFGEDDEYTYYTLKFIAHYAKVMNYSKKQVMEQGFEELDNGYWRIKKEEK